MNQLAIHEYLRPLIDHNALTRICAETGYSKEKADKLLRIYIEEAAHGYNLIKPYLRKNIKILEIGGGLMLLCCYLRGAGYNITSIEPVVSGFSFFKIKDTILNILGTNSERLFNISVENIDYKKHGSFDLIYSINVLEHIADIDKAFNRMSAVLNPDGMMIHTCPNYFIPYEPHFSIPLIPVKPELTRHIFSKKISQDQDLWNSLNFINYRKVDALSAENGLVVYYKKGILGSAFTRLYKDKEFSDRHNTVIKSIIGLLLFLRIDKILNRVPGKYLTPMTFTLRKATI